MFWLLCRRYEVPAYRPRRRCRRGEPRLQDTTRPCRVRRTGNFHCRRRPPGAAPRTTARSIIRLPEKAALTVDTSAATAPTDCVTLGGPPQATPQATGSAYLRAAHAYMLISMPTGTSTLFGVFQ